MGQNSSKNNTQENKSLIESDGMIYSKDEKKVTLEDFALLKLVGKGNFAKVFQVRKKDTDSIYAMKILSKAGLKKANQLDHIKTERVILEYSDFPFMVHLVYAFQTEDKLYMVMDFVNGGELFFHLKKSRRFKENRAKFYAAEMFLGLNHLHNQNIIYRDLKPENVLMDKDGHVLLTDFGLCKILTNDDPRTHTFCGTPEYLAPEVVLQEGHGKAVDWWAFGTILYEMMVGIPPFYDENVQEMYDKILHQDISFPDFLSDEACDLISRLLEKKPNKRFGTKSSDEIKKHPFFKEVNWEKLLKKEIPTPYQPTIKNALDTSYFDDEFTRENVKDQLQQSMERESTLNTVEQKAFEGFTFSEDKAFGTKEEQEESEDAMTVSLNSLDK